MFSTKFSKFLSGPMVFFMQKDALLSKLFCSGFAYIVPSLH